MSKHFGLWIDHRQATLVSLTGETEAITHIASDLEKHIRFSGGPEMVSAEDMRDRRYANHLNQFYQAVSAGLRDADAILIIGPGEAKGELAKWLAHEHMGDRIVGVESADKLTDGQIAAYVRAWFKEWKEPAAPR